MPPGGECVSNVAKTVSGKRTHRYSSAQRWKYVNKIVTVAVVKPTTPAVRARKPKA
jgi:hypothetical protein